MDGRKMNVKERALRIGAPTPLVGVMSEPPQFDSTKPAVIVLNSGVMHHVGACQLSVKIARAVAGRGLLAVRFDYSGIGDSEPRRGADSFEDVSLRECAEVMDYVQRTRGVSRFILYGLCSGADAAYNTALADDRVIGTAQIDAYCYTTKRYYIEHYGRAMLRLPRWKSFITRQLRRLSGRATPARAVPMVDSHNFELPSYVRIFPPRERVAEGLAALMRRGLRMHVIFTGGEQHYNHQSQFRASFPEVPFEDRLTVDYFRGANHIITQPEYQRMAVEQVATFATEVAAELDRSPTTAPVVVGQVRTVGGP